jgi:NAD(P)-dependent dehydrogenase (short-subunit alcohol dehydrogenase family)
VVKELNSLRAAQGSQLLLVSIESTSRSDPVKAVEQVRAAGIDRVDIVIANAGISHPPTPLESVDPESFVEAFNINTVGTIVLFQAVSGLLAQSSAPKWVSVSSRVGSVGDAVDFFSFAGSYGISKAAQNWFTS